MKSLRMAASIALLAVALGGCETVERRYEQFTMTFFITSTGTGKGADLGGLDGADQHCQALASKAGAGHRTWRAYLSNTLSPGSPTVHARDRIGKGPWQNAKGAVIANNLSELHGKNNLSKQTALNEMGQMVNGRGDTPNEHDILTGSRPDGTAMAGDPGRTTCGNWTLSGAGAAIVGHHDRLGLRDDEASRSWNSSHPSRGCSLDNLRASGGAGLIYCFAAN
jgi:hypothetical protein